MIVFTARNCVAFENISQEASCRQRKDMSGTLLTWETAWRDEKPVSMATDYRGSYTDPGQSTATRKEATRAREVDSSGVREGR